MVGVPGNKKMETLEDVLERTDLNIETGCLEWNRHLNWSGYALGSFSGKTMAMHRVVANLTLEKPLEADTVMHLCDNRKCINPEHLKWGTQAENNADKVAKNRQGRMFGSKNPRAKATEKMVVEMRELRNAGMTGIAIAEKYGMNKWTVYALLRGDTWNNVGSHD